MLLKPAKKMQKDVSNPPLPLGMDSKNEYYVKNVLKSKYQWAKLYYLVK